MNISNDRLRVIGKLIGIYREERRQGSQNNWTQKKFCEEICSPNTLKSIEAGGLSRSIDVYTDILDKFNLKLGEYDVIDDAVNELLDELYEAIEYFDCSNIKKITSKLMRILEKVKNYVYYSELYEIFKDLQLYYLNDDYISYEKVDRYTKEMYFLPFKLQDIFRILIFAKMKPESITDKESFSKLILSIELTNSVHVCLKLNLIDYYYIQGKYMSMKDLINELELSFKIEENWIRLMDTYQYASVLLGSIDFDKSIEYIRKAENLVNEINYPKMKLSELYSNIAMAYYVNRNFEIALEYLNLMTKLCKQKSLDTLILMSDCQNRLNKFVNVPEIDEKDFLKYPANIRMMYKYFTFKDDIPDFAKENYIMKRILPVLNDDIYTDVFRFELLKLVDKTGHYKNIHTFEKAIKEVVTI